MMTEEMGWTDIREEEIPLGIDDLSYECQQALILFNTLPDRVEGMSGTWLGKDYSGLHDIMDLLEIKENRKEIFSLLQVCISESSKFYEEKRKLASKQLETRR